MLKNHKIHFSTEKFSTEEKLSLVNNLNSTYFSLDLQTSIIEESDQGSSYKYFEVAGLLDKTKCFRPFDIDESNLENIPDDVKNALISFLRGSSNSIEIDPESKIMENSWVEGLPVTVPDFLEITKIYLS